MKKSNLLILILIFILTIVGCKPTMGFEDMDNHRPEDGSLSIEEYFPFTPNKIFEYEGVGNEFAEQKTYFEFIDKNKAQVKIINPATNVIRVIKHEDGILKEIYYEGEFYHIENMLGVTEERDNIILKEPFEVGNSWAIQDGLSRSITGVDVEIKTPMDTFKALEVTTDLGEGNTQKYYYAKGIGMVASIYEGSEGKVETLLKSVTDGPLEFNIEAYYPFSTDIETVYLKDKISFYTNEDVVGLLEELMKNPSKEMLVPIISKSTTINSIVLDRSIWAVKVDFSKELVTEMNAGSTLETEILKSITNTLGRFYDVERVFISIEGDPYESGHYAFIYDEYLTVDTEGIEEYK